MTKTITVRMEVPDDLEQAILKMGPVQWGCTDAVSDAKHKAWLGESIDLTRKDFGREAVPDLTEMHGVYLDGMSTIVCHTGVSPNSPNNARVLAGLWNAIHTTLLNDQHVEAADAPHAGS